MSKGKELAPKVRIRYKKANDYRIIYADNAMVGDAGGRGISIDFYVGSYDLHDELHELAPDKKIYMPIVEQRDELDYTRELQVMVVMTPENAETLCNFIIERLKAFKEQPV